MPRIKTRVFLTDYRIASPKLHILYINGFRFFFRNNEKILSNEDRQYTYDLLRYLINTPWVTISSFFKKRGISLFKAGIFTQCHKIMLNAVKQQEPLQWGRYRGGCTAPPWTLFPMVFLDQYVQGVEKMQIRQNKVVHSAWY